MPPAEILRLGVLLPWVALLWERPPRPAVCPGLGLEQEPLGSLELFQSDTEKVCGNELQVCLIQPGVFLVEHQLGVRECSTHRRLGLLNDEHVGLQPKGVV